MNSNDHNKVLGILHLVYGGFNVLVIFVTAIFMLVMLGFIGASARDNAALPMGIFGLIMIVVLLVNIVLTAPSFIAGYAMLRRKRWAKVAGLVAAVLEGLSIPFGTALCVYTLWFLFSDNGKHFYDKDAHMLPPPPPQWGTASVPQREAEYAPRDWR
jgi:hypothetical protein